MNLDFARDEGKEYREKITGYALGYENSGI